MATGSPITAELAEPLGAPLRARAPRRDIPLAMAIERALPFAAATLAFAAYLVTLAPTISILDSPELSAAAITLGVAHPTGYPLFTLIGHAFAIAIGALVGGDPAWRLNLLTALFAAAAVGVVAAVGRRLTGRASAGWLAAGAFAFSPAFWRQANVVEVYALHLLFSAALLWLWLRFEKAAVARDGEAARRFLRVLAFSVGLSFTHHLMTALLLPIVALSLIRHVRVWWSPNETLGLCLLGLAPLSLYVYLPLVASSDPIVNWGNPRSLAALWYHVSGAQYHHNLGSLGDGAAAKSLFEALTQHAATFGRQLPLVLLPLAALGAFRSGANRGVEVGLAVGFAAALLFGFSYGVVDGEPFLLNATLIAALWIGCGAAALRSRLDGAPRAAATYEALLWLAPAAMLVSGLPAADRHGEYQPHDHAVAALALLPRNAVLVTQGPAGYPPVYAQLVEGLRPDVAVVDMYLNVRGSYGPQLDRLRQSRLPDGMTREIALTETVAGLDGGTRSLWLMPGVPDAAWHELGLTRLRGGIVEPLVRGRADLHADATSGPPIASFAGRIELLAASPQVSHVESGSALEIRYRWRVAAQGPASEDAPTVTLVLADAEGTAPTGPDDLPLVEQKRPLGRGVGLAAFAPGDVLGESLSLLVPRALEPGHWWIWIALRNGDEWLELADGRLFARAGEIEVTPRVRPLWTLPAP